MKSLSMSSQFREAAPTAAGRAQTQGEASGADAAAADAGAKFLQSPEMDLVKSLLTALLGERQPAQPRMDKHSACDTIAQFMEGSGKGTLDTAEMNNLASGKQPGGGGEVPPEVAKAAAWIMGGPKGGSGESARWEKIETRDVAGADGLSGLGNFKNIAAEGKPAAPAPQEGDNMADLLEMFTALQQQNAMLAQMMTQGFGGGSQASPLDDIAKSFSQLQQDSTKNLALMLQSAG